MKTILDYVSPLIVKNLNGTSNNKCECNSWIEHWEKFSNSERKECSVLGCNKTEDLVGAHVQIKGKIGWIIIPMCKYHNGQKEEELNCAKSIAAPEDIFVSANVKETCGKKSSKKLDAS